MVCTKVNQLLVNNFHAIMGKIEADMFQIIKKGTGNRWTNIKDTSAEWFHLQMPALQQSMCISKVSLLRLRHIWTIYKDKLPDMSHFLQNITASSNSKLK